MFKPPVRNTWGKASFPPPRRLILCLAPALLMALGCHSESRDPVERLHSEALVWDGHSDIVHSILLQDLDLAQRNCFSFQDIPRMQEGGLDVQVFALLPDRIYFPRRSARRTLQLIDIMLDAIQKNQETIDLVRTASDIERVVRSGRIAAILGIEGGHALEDDLRLLRMYNRLGVTLMTLTHANSNHWADSATDQAISGGLSDFGHEVIHEMNRLDMVIDVSHCSDQVFYQVLNTSLDPVIASHSNCRALCDHPRNLTDDMIRTLAEKGGVICVTTVPGYTTQAFKDAREQALRNTAAHESSPPEIPEDLDEWAKARRLAPLVMPDMPFPTLDDVLDHLDHIVGLVGADSVGIGHDFSVVYPGPQGMRDVSEYPNLTRKLRERGYTDPEIKKILGENLLRVWRQVTEL